MICSLRDAATSLDELGVKVYGICRDDVSSVKRFAEEHTVNFELLSDPDGSVVDKYGTLKGDRVRRISFVLDTEGTLRFVDDGVRLSEHGNDLAKRIRDLQR